MIFQSFFVIIVVGFFSWLYDYVVIKPKKIRRILSEQGVYGPPPGLLLGNILEMKRCWDEEANSIVENECPPIIHNTTMLFGFLEKWRRKYGQVYMFSLGMMQVLCASQPDLVKDITASMSELDRSLLQQKQFGPLLGKGILSTAGSIWAAQKKIIAPQLYMDKVKGMMDIIGDAALAVTTSWGHEIEKSGKGVVEIGVDYHMKRFSSDVISKACFGGNYSKGNEIFSKLGEMLEIFSSNLMILGVPGLRYVPTRSNRRMWSLEKEIKALIWSVVKERRERGEPEKNDLLQVLLERANSSYSTPDSIREFIVDNCRSIYLAGFETSAAAATWCFMLLASNPNWQTRVRDEVNQVCQGAAPTADMLRNMKQLHMVIQETLRLYPLAPSLSREALADITIGGIRVPKGTHIWVFMTALQTDPATWGPDALEFNPERFQNGIAAACKSPSSYMPFGFGQHVCVGQHLAITELKLLVATIVTSFSFTLSPNYVHHPAMKLVIEPKFGVKIMVRKL